MPRNSSGTMTLPAGNPVVTSTTISTTWANTTLGDISTEISSSLDRSGRGGMTAPIRTPDGTVAAPAHAFTSEPATGLYRAATGDVRLAIGGVDMLTPGGVAFPSATSPIVKSTGATTSLLLQGNRGAAEGFADVTIGSTATRTAGLIADFHNPIGVTSKLQIDFQGLLRLASQAAPLQPASMVTAITPNALWTAAGGLAYWKDATGMVRLRGGVVYTTGAGAVVFTLPAGFRPSTGDRWFACATGGTGFIMVQVRNDGTVQIPFPPANSTTTAVDPVCFLAEA